MTTDSCERVDVFMFVCFIVAKKKIVQSKNAFLIHMLLQKTRGIRKHAIFEH